MRYFKIWLSACVLTVVCVNSVLAQRDGRPRESSRDVRSEFYRTQTGRWDWIRNRDDDRRNRRNYDFGQKRHTRALAEELYLQANTICLEMHEHYRRNHGFREAYSEMYGIRAGAKRIHDLTRDNYQRERHNDDKIARELNELDKLFHHIEDHVQGWRADRRDASRGGELTVKMALCEDTLHHLMEDYGVRRPHHDQGNGHEPRQGRENDHDHRN